MRLNLWADMGEVELLLFWTLLVFRYVWVTSWVLHLFHRNETAVLKCYAGL